MKHNFSFLPSLRRTTLLALLCLGMMPMWGETNVYIKDVKGTYIWFQYTCTGHDYTQIKIENIVCEEGNWFLGVIPVDAGGSISHFKFQVENGSDYYSGYLGDQNQLTVGGDNYLTIVNKNLSYNQKSLYDSECVTPTCTNCAYLGE